MPSDRSTELKSCPWTVHVGKLRPQFPTPIVEIYDANDDVVLPWSSFDATGLSGAKQKALARRIVNAVNAVTRKEDANDCRNEA